jgi:hypothetical protein
MVLLISGGAVTLVGGALAGVGGVIGYGGAQGSLPTGDGKVAADPARVGALSLGRTLTTAGFIGIGVGIATGLLGALLIGLHGAPTLGLSVHGGGAAIVLGGSF